MNNKYNNHQSVKVEKENENINLQKKIKSFTTDKHLVNKHETVWDRLSKIKKVSSTGNVLETANLRSHHTHINSKTPQTFHSIKKSSLKQCLQVSKEPYKKRLNNPQKTLLKNPEYIRELNNDIFLCDKPFDEITSYISRNDSKYSLENKVGVSKLANVYTESTLYQSNRKKKEFSESSSEQYTLEPLLASFSEERTENNVNRFLRLNNTSMKYKDTDILIDVAKSDSICTNLEGNPKLLKDVLKTELKNILLQEFGVDKVVHKVESSVNLQKGHKVNFPEQTNKIVEFTDCRKGIQKFEVDVIFKNVPSLDKEIEILKSLGEKLETTLKIATFHMGKQIPIDTTKQSIKIKEEKNALVMLKVKHDFITQHFVLVSIQPLGICQCVGIIHEFSASQKSIFELKREASCQFFIPSNCKNIQLMKTSFKNLEKTPKELLRHIKGKKSEIAFNVLEQDPIFFFSALSSLSKIPYFPLKNSDPNNKRQLLTKQSGDTNIGIALKLQAPLKESKDLMSFNFNSHIQSNLDNNLFKIQNDFEPIIYDKKRKLLKRFVTPMPMGYYHCPKNLFIKRILVGFVQVSLFIIFIMALTHPGLRCLNSSI